MASGQDVVNSRLYRRPELVRQYAQKTTLYPAEAAALARYADDIRGRAVLELGCGAGRLTAHVAPLASRYVGVDISPHMVSYCRARFEDLEFLVRDMREIRELPDGAFRAVFAIANLLDAIDHADRLRVLASIRRVLAPGGLLVFSSHNRAWEQLGAPPRLELSPHPLELLRRSADFARAHLRRRRARRLEQHTPDYAVVTDPGHDFGVLHYYIARATQTRQLAAHGFTLLDAFDGAGNPLTQHGDDRASPSLVYVARRAE
ncbi:MAG TPA: class I SAM-dependent methyltransferase [Kofleriaceae bacterium]|jgi:SAM-dependent methyltransferase